MDEKNTATSLDNQERRSCTIAVLKDKDGMVKEVQVTPWEG